MLLSAYNPALIKVIVGSTGKEGATTLVAHFEQALKIHKKISRCSVNRGSCTIFDCCTQNSSLTAEISKLDERIKEILSLEKKKDRLVARMKIIEQLQKSRPEIVHVFEDLVRTLPDGVHLTSVRQTGRRLEIQGTAESNTRVSAFMRNISTTTHYV